MDDVINENRKENKGNYSAKENLIKVSIKAQISCSSLSRYFFDFE